MRKLGVAMLVAVLALFAGITAFGGQHVAAGIHARAAPGMTVAQHQPAEPIAMYAVLPAADYTMRESTTSEASADRMPMVACHERWKPPAGKRLGTRTPTLPRSGPITS
jgi:hypothetical protein